MKIRFEETDDIELLERTFLEHELEMDEDEFTGDRTRLIQGYAAYDDDAGGKFVGAVALAERLGRTVINGIAVDKEYRRRGIAADLLDLAVKKAEELGEERIWIVAKAPLFFMSQGFKETEMEKVPENLFDCPHCPQYLRECFPKLMIRDL